MTNNQKAMRGMDGYGLSLKPKVYRRVEAQPNYLNTFRDKHARNLCRGGSTQGGARCQGGRADGGGLAVKPTPKKRPATSCADRRRAVAGTSPGRGTCTSRN